VLVLPIMLLLVGATVDLGRLFYAYVAVENAAKEGALVGARAPLCDRRGASSCDDPNNVVWHVEHEAPNLVDADGDSLLTSTVACRKPDGTLVQSISNCLDGYTYQVTVSTPFRMITPLLSGMVPSDFTLTKLSQATVITDAFDPSGLEVLVWVSTSNALNASAVIAACAPAESVSSPGYYYQPCQDQSNVDNYLQFNEATAANVAYKVHVRNTGNVNLTNITYAFSENGIAFATPAGCTGLPTSLAANSVAVYCTFSRPPTAASPAAGLNDSTVSVRTNALADGLTTGIGNGGSTIRVWPAPRLAINLKAAPYRLGGTGNGTSGVPAYALGDLTLSRDAASSVAEIRNPTGWLYLSVVNDGGPANAFTVSVKQNGTAVTLPASCVIPSTLAASGEADDSFTCTFPRTFSATQAYTLVATASATNALVVPGTQPSVTITTATCNKKVVPNLVDTLSPAADGTNRTVGQATTAWPTAGFTGGLTTSPAGLPGGWFVTTQTQPAYTCRNANSAVVVTAQETQP
jgi:hypothetical protein